MSKNREELLQKDPKELMFKLCTPAILGIKAVWFVTPMIDTIVFLILLYLISREYKIMKQQLKVVR